MQHPTLLKALTNFGVSETEARIYLSLFSHSPQTIVQLSKNLDIPRTTLYDHIDKIVKLGLVERIITYKSQAFKAHPIKILENLILQKQQEAESLQQSFNTLHALLPTLNPHTSATQTRYYHGVQGLQQMLYNALQAKKETVGYSVYGRASIVGKTFMKRWVAEFHHLKLNDRVITNPRPETLAILQTDIKPKLHQQTLKDIRYLPETSLYVSGDTTIYNSTFAVCYWQQGELVGVEIENEELVHTQKTIFETLWSQALPIKTLLYP